MIKMEGGKKRRIDNAEASTKDNFENKGECVPATSSDATLEQVGATGNSEESANCSQNVSERKREDNDCVKSTSASHAAIQSDVEVARNESKKATDKDSYETISDSSAAAVSTKKSKKKKGKKGGKSAPDTSRTEPLTGVEHEGHDPDYSDTFLQYRTEMQKLISARISEIESRGNEAQPIKYSKKKVKYQPASEGEIKISIKPIKKDIPISSLETEKTETCTAKILASANPSQSMAERMDKVKSTCATHTTKQSRKKRGKNKNDNKVKEDIDFLYNYNQQTAFPEKESTDRTKYEGGKLNSSDSFDYMDADMRKYFTEQPSASEVITTQTKNFESMGSTEDDYIDYFNRPAIFMADNFTQTDPVPEPPDTSEPTNEENKGDMNSGSDSTIKGEATAQQNVPENTDISEETGSDLLSILQDLQIFSDELAKDLKVAEKKLSENYMKCLKKQK